MKFLQDAQGVHGFDTTDPAQVTLMNSLYYTNGVLNSGVTDVSSTWPPAPAPLPLPVQAQQKLDIVTGHRGTIIRCLAAGVAVPPAWTSYVVSLRNIVNGTDKTSTSLPTEPAFPAGT